jgi:hypothetical protein
MGMKTWRQSGAALSAAGLFLGYLVAVITTRPLGGVVLIGFGIAAFLVWARAVRMEMALKLGGLYVGLFIVAHIIGLILGGWTAVILVSLVMAAASWWFADSRAEKRVPR